MLALPTGGALDDAYHLISTPDDGDESINT
jgi:hypothetical protein